MLPRALCQRNLSLHGDEIVLAYFTERDHVWLRALLDEYTRYAGDKQKLLKDRLKEPLPVVAPRWKLRIAQHVLDKLCQTRHTAAVPPREARRLLFHVAARKLEEPRSGIIDQVAHTLGVAASELEAALFADLASERRVGQLSAELGPAQLAEQANLAMVGTLLGRARELHIAVRGQARALVRQARLAGLICVVERDSPAAACSSSRASAPRTLAKLDALREEAAPRVVLHISGPYALFRQTRIYGRALAALVPRVAWCNEYKLTAECMLHERGEPLRFVVKSGDPIPAGKELKRFDSRVEERFTRSFAKLATDWEVIREPEPISFGQRLMFPDFELRHRHRRQHSWYLEIAGFWTDEYLAHKLAQLRQADIERLIVCVDDKLRCSKSDFPEAANIIRYKRSIDAKAVLARLEQSPPDAR